MSNDLVTYSCVVQLKPIASKAATYVLVGQLLPLALAGISTRMPRLGTEFDEGSVLGNRNVGMAMHLLIPLQVLHSIAECLCTCLVPLVPVPPAPSFAAEFAPPAPSFAAEPYVVPVIFRKVYGLVW